MEERGPCTCASRDPDWTVVRTHAWTHTRAVMISSSLGRCTSGAQRGGNITFLFLFMCGNVFVVVFVDAAHLTAVVVNLIKKVFKSEHYQQININD